MGKIATKTKQQKEIFMAAKIGSTNYDPKVQESVCNYHLQRFGLTKNEIEQMTVGIKPAAETKDRDNGKI